MKQERTPPVYFDPDTLIEPTSLRDMAYMSNTDQARKMMYLFWWCNDTHAWEQFPFKGVFKEVRSYIEHRVQSVLYLIEPGESKYGILGVYGQESLADMRVETLKELIIDLDRWYKREQLAGVKRPGLPTQARGMKENHRVIQRLLHLYIDLRDVDSRSEKIVAMDHVIHLEHEMGNFWGITVANLRKRYAQEYKPSFVSW